MKQWCGFCPVRCQDLSASPAYISFNSELDRLHRIQELGWGKYYIFSFRNLKLKFSIFQLKCRPQTTYHRSCDFVAKRSHRYFCITLQLLQIIQNFISAHQSKITIVIIPNAQFHLKCINKVHINHKQFKKYLDNSLPV